MSDDEPLLLKCDPPVRPPGDYPRCACFVFQNRKRKLPRLHTEVQDTESEAWARVCENIDSARRTGQPVLEPLAGLSGTQRSHIVTLPSSVSSLPQVKELRLYCYRAG